MGTVFIRIAPRQVEQLFLDWLMPLFEWTMGKVVAHDGKTLRHTYDRTFKKTSLQMVFAWVTGSISS